MRYRVTWLCSKTGTRYCRREVLSYLMTESTIHLELDDGFTIINRGNTIHVNISTLEEDKE